MSDEFNKAMLAACTTRILLVIGVVAVVAYTMRSRDVFLGGVIGSLLGLIVPQAVVREMVNYGPGGHASLTAIARAGQHVLGWGFLGATVGCGLVAFAISRNPRSQFSLRHAIGWMTAIAIALGVKLLWFQ
jgi:hypothetical protein